ncbi:MAG TPA: glutamine--tRNA ligase/YqeY domain fusion protein [Caldilineaceae bacterium]|nr:glutamine--tRNA ligase/YqeY domain fusion protein [Caldilineaceae bacterium]
MGDQLVERATTDAAPAAGPERPETMDFIRAIVAEDVRKGTYGGRVVTRFPPEPNGFLHIGHAKSICLNFGIAADFGGVCNLRMDDTNPETEDLTYVEAIKRDVRWLGFDWGDRLYFASDYYEELYDYALKLIKAGKAYVDSLSEEEIREYRGTVTEPGRPSPYRDRSVEENLDLFERMRAGEFPDGAHVLRAKIDMASPNMKMRDPLLYRIRHATHYRTGDAWCIYPMYDFAHPLSDAIEGVTHSICTLEFENNREIYDWLMENTQTPPWPHQYEFARLNLDYTVMSKRKLLQLVEGGYVDGWDDPRMPTIAGLRRRGVTPEAIRDFSERVGVAKTNSRVEISLLEHCIRDDLNFRAPRVMAVLRPLKLVILNYPEGATETLEGAYWPRDIPKEGTRPLPFSRELYIEQDDFMENPPADFYRLAPGREVRLRFAYIVKCVDVVKDPATGRVIEVHCTYDPETKGGVVKGRKVQGAVHWVSAAHALPAEVRLYDRLFTVPNPDEVEEGKSFLDYVNPRSREILTGCWVEPSVAGDPAGSRYQFERLGYFVSDMEDSRPGRLVFNRIIELRDSWAKTVQPKAVPAQAAPERPAPTPATEPAEGRRSRTEARDALRAATPELATRLARYTEELGLPFEDADVLTGDLALARFFEQALAVYNNPKSVANWVVNEVLRAAKEAPVTDLPISGAQLGALVALVDGETISATLGKEVFAEMVKTGADPRQLVAERGLAQINDPAALAPVVARVVEANPEKAAQYRSGKTGLLGFFVGQVMRETQSRANPKLAQELVQQRLAAE